MRWSFTLIVILASLGCRSSATPITNPFLAPDRVPPPATGALQPGAAQPFYPGDQVPVSPGGAAPGFVPPSTGYPPPPQTSPVTPPGGWNQPAPAGSVTPYGVQPTSGYAPATLSAVESQVVRVAPDNENLRFASVPNSNPSDILQVAAEQQTLVQQGYVHTPPIATQGFTQSQAQMSVDVLPATPPLSGAASDGFRPQGSSRAADSSFVSHSESQPLANQSQEDSNLFGYDASYTWLRGQLQFYPEKGVWGLRYITIGAGLDQYGGIAVINNTEVLGGLQPGEHLLVQGSMEVLDAGGGQFMPSYTVEGIQRQR
ncbi:hypothetical protein [Bythopirellula polymerisocia]|uniref:Uncharacterized protein n=1 Tax=Bythopirellula polymerisocia TaxID=2528003 RepID=A0A5C6CWD1_9BACT|nr:hypothetical protein [Bythopirellula polymerisocia]TWU27286.1 hypothetical protein Pla144_20580 [Bythopirellula polymerisocia]